MKFSVVLVNFNGIAWLDSCLASVLGQTLDEGFSIELIVVDNSSADESVDFIKQNYPGVILIESASNTGFASGCELGIARCTGEILVLLNIDVRLEPNALQSLFLEKVERELDVIAAIEARYDGGEPIYQRITIDILGFPIALGNGQRFSNGPSFYLSAACVMVGRQTYRESGGLDTSFFLYYEDSDWFWRLQLFGYRFDYSLSTLVYHALHGSSGGLSLDYKRFLWRNTNQPQILIKNYRLITLMIVLPLYLANSLLEMAALTVLGRRDLVKSYPAALRLIVRNRQNLLRNRRIIQRKRVVGDLRIISRMYPGIASVRGFMKKATQVRILE